MVVFGRPKVIKLGDFGHDKVVETQFVLANCYFISGIDLLLFTVKEDSCAVLCAYIDTLSVQLSRIVYLEKYLEQFGIRDNIGIKRKLHDFGMSRLSRFHLLVGWKVHVSAAVS